MTDTQTPVDGTVVPLAPPLADDGRVGGTNAADPLAPGGFGRWIAGHPLVLLYANVPALIMPTLHPKIAHVLSEKDRALNGSEGWNFSIFKGGETFASKIANNAGEFDNPTKTGAYIAAGLVLFILTFVVNALARAAAGGRVSGG